jgi:hypothetical protein
MPEPTTAADQFTRIDRFLSALARDVETAEGRTLDYETSEVMLRTINAALAEAIFNKTATHQHELSDFYRRRLIFPDHA